MTKIKVGVQVYSVRDFAERDFVATMQNIKDMGYEGVEFAGLYGNSAQYVKQVIDKIGLIAMSAHVPYDLLVEDTENIINDYVTIGVEYIAIPYLTPELRPEAGNFEEVIANIEMIGKACKAKGIQLLYHNHDFEFFKLDNGQYALDYMYEKISSDYLGTELDTCWINVAGEDPSAYVKKYANRCPVVHLKDFYIDRSKKAENLYGLIGIDDEDKEDEKSSFELRPLGLGIQDLPSIITASLDSKAQWIVVEQDESIGRTSLEAIEISRKYLKSLGY